jgi:division protein CdvB (Snf7/Vps24/ESCRT-III family)
MTFANRWEKSSDPSFAVKVKDAVRPPGPLKPRLDAATKGIEMQIQRLDQASHRFQDRDKTIFNRIVDAYAKHDTARANVFANELAEIRKMEKMIFHAKLALEQITLRLKTVTELGDVAITLLPVVGVKPISSLVCLQSVHKLRRNWVR